MYLNSQIDWDSYYRRYVFKCKQKVEDSDLLILATGTSKEFNTWISAISKAIDLL